MRTILANGVRLSYVERGSGDETVVFSHSYLVDHRQFDAQISALERRFRVVAYDHRDHGASERTARPYDMEDLFLDGVSFVEAIGHGPVHWIGLSAGGFVGVRIAVRRPDLLRSLVLMDTSAESEPIRNRIRYGLMLAALARLGFRPVTGGAMKAMFGPRFLSDPDRRNERDLWKSRILANDPAALVRFGRAIFGRDDLRQAVRSVDVPTLVVVGEHDRAKPPAECRRLAQSIPGAGLEVVARGGHLCTIEEPAAVNAILTRFLSDPGRTSRRPNR